MSLIEGPRVEVRLLRSSLALWDVLCWAIATLVLLAARYDFSLNEVQWAAVLTYPVAAGATQVVLGIIGRLYRGGFRVGSFGEAAVLAAIVAVVALAVGAGFLLWVPELPRGVAVTAPLGALSLMAAGRFVARALLLQITKSKQAGAAERVLVYGAGNAGQQLGRLLLYDPEAPYYVAGFVDDDPAKRHLRLANRQVLGTRSDLVRLARERGITTVIAALPSASGSFLRSLATELEAEGLTLLVLPAVREMVGGRVAIDQVHRIDVNDILGRRQLDTGISEIAEYLSGKVVLVTGAGGSIGSEIARQVHTFGPAELVLLDRDESGLHSVQLSIYGKALLNTRDMVLCDIRDVEALDAVFAAHKPEVVFHAAALKHLPMLEMYPEEGWKTNVLGTLNVLEAAHRYGVGKFVNISTDKAAEPTSVLGRTKRKAEELTAWFAAQGPGSYLSVRFGNVLGSRGSVLHTFAAQIAKGGPVTVVHPDITRYFMTIPEACELTIQAGALGRPGDVMVLDMGEPIRILDVAKRLIAQSGKQIEIVFTGLRQGEKLHEVLFSENEEAERLEHPLISHVSVPPLDPRDLPQLSHQDEPAS